VVGRGDVGVEVQHVAQVCGVDLDGQRLHQHRHVLQRHQLQSAIYCATNIRVRMHGACLELEQERVLGVVELDHCAARMVVRDTCYWLQWPRGCASLAAVRCGSVRTCGLEEGLGEDGGGNVGRVQDHGEHGAVRRVVHLHALNPKLDRLMLRRGRQRRTDT
jgi:hypothetical protein